MSELPRVEVNRMTKDCKGWLFFSDRKISSDTVITCLVLMASRKTHLLIMSASKKKPVEIFKISHYYVERIYSSDIYHSIIIVIILFIILFNVIIILIPFYSVIYKFMLSQSQYHYCKTFRTIKNKDFMNFNLVLVL